MIKLLRQYGIIVGLIGVLAACSFSNKLTKENYDKIQPGMSYQQVIDILGTPKSADAITFGNLSGTSAIWQNKQITISIQFFNDAVKIKSFTTGDNDAHTEEEMGD
ncbi:MAG: DUF3862 domain-containing protein [Gammaproteobacteria bacterium]